MDWSWIDVVGPRVLGTVMVLTVYLIYLEWRYRERRPRDDDDDSGHPPAPSTVPHEEPGV